MKGKTILITGGAKRIGRAIALAAAKAGADVGITFMASAREARQTVLDVTSFGVRGFAFPCDVKSEKSVKAMVKDAVRELGGIDVLVNNAGMIESLKFEDITVERWDRVFNSNVRGPFLVSKEALPHLRERKGRIVNLGSLGGLKAWITHPHYCASKAALHHLSRVMAKALAPEISVNTVAPGMIDMGAKKDEAFMRKMAKKTPMRRNGTGEEVATAVMFFATGPKFITGQLIAVDGGVELLTHGGEDD